MRFETITLTAPITEPVTLDEAKAQLRLTSGFTADDDYITSLISVARDRSEQFCNRFFTIQSVKIVYFDSLPYYSGIAGAIELPYSNLTSVDEVSYTDTVGDTVVIDSADYIFNADTKKLYPVTVWPIAVDFNVTVTTAAPAEFNGAKHAMLMLLTDMYELRTETVIGASVADNPAVNTLLAQYRENMGI